MRRPNLGPAGAEGGTTPSAIGYAGAQEIAETHCYTCHGVTTNAAGANLNLETNFHAATVGVVGFYGLVLVTPDSLETRCCTSSSRGRTRRAPGRRCR